MTTVGIRWILVISCLLATTLCDGNAVPRKMKQLYKQFKRGNVEGDVNTVRYIRPLKGSETSQGKLLFDLDSLQKDNETFVRAELHFYRRSTESMWTIQVDTFEVSSYYISLVERRRLTPLGKGWQLMNITDSVHQCTNTISTNNKLGVAFSQVNEEGVATPVNMPQFLKHHDMPFILLYSYNTRSLEMDQITDRTKMSAKEMAQALNEMINPKTGKAFSQKNKHYRERRDVFDNKIDFQDEMSEHDEEEQYNEITNKVEVVKPDTKGVNIEDVTPNAVESVTSKKPKQKVELIPWPKFYVKSRKSKSFRKKLPSPRKFKSSEMPTASAGCARKPLRLNFEDLGWGERVIEPRKMDAYYCLGACSFPLSYGNHLTNHATLQSLITTIQHKTKIPQPCCVPHQLDSVTLLFYDKDMNIVLKSYPDMSVKSCVCR